MKNTLRLLLLIIWISGFSFPAYAQDSISPEDAGKYLRQQKTVCGKVVSTHYAVKSKGQPTFLNFGKPYPQQVFTVVIWNEDRGKFGKAPEGLFRDKEVCVSGLIVEHNGKAQMVVRNPGQMRSR